MLIFLFLAVFNNFFTSHVDNESVRRRLALVIPTGVPTTIANNIIEMPSPVAHKTVKDLSKQSKEAINFLSLLLIDSVFLISAMK